MSKPTTPKTDRLPKKEKSVRSKVAEGILKTAHDLRDAGLMPDDRLANIENLFLEKDKPAK